MRCVKDWWKILAPCNYRGMYALVVERQVLHFVVFVYVLPRCLLVSMNRFPACSVVWC